jgi:hypothetical protein
MTNNSQKTLLIVALSLAGLFVLFFALGYRATPLPFGLKVVKLPFMEAPAPKKYFTGKVPMPKDTIPYFDFGKLSMYIDTSRVKSKKPKVVKAVSDSIPPMYLKPYRHVDCSDSCLPRILLLGDSQLEGLRRPVYNYCVANGYDLVASIVWYGSSTKQWGSTDTLAYFIDRYDPVHVIFAIGLNELFVNDFDDRRTYIDHIMGTFADKGVGYTWIGPAAWKEDKGVIDIMREKVGKHFFSSEKLVLARAKDGMHPSNDAARVWMDSVATFMRKTTDIHFQNKSQGDPKYAYSPFILLQQPK